MVNRIFYTLAFFLFISTGGASSQNSGRGIGYQAIALDEFGNPVRDQNIELKISLLSGLSGEESSVYFMETQQVVTDNTGSFSLVLGQGSVHPDSKYSYAEISFYRDFWLKIEMMSADGYLELTTTKLLSTPYAENATPVGSVIPFAGEADKIPDGWMLCDGSLLDIKEYPGLYNAIGKNWFKEGSPLPDSSFRIPDLRGRFLTGVKYDAYPPGTYFKGDKLPLHSHYMFYGESNYSNSSNYLNNQIINHQESTVSSEGSWGSSAYAMFTAKPGYPDDPENGLSGPEGDLENRPRNKAVNFIIRVH